MFKDKFIEIFNNKKIGIWGLGREGLSSLNFINELNINRDIYLFDNNGSYPKLGNFTILNDVKDLNNCDLILISPGIPFNDSFGVDEDKITSQTAIFLSIYKKQIIGITGTKGKSTTTSLIYQILNENKNNVVMLGNIGIPAFDKINEIDENTIIVDEISCHQLRNVKDSPHIAVLLNIYQEHLDYYSYDYYKELKRKIFKYQNNNDILISQLEFTDGDNIQGVLVDIYNDIKIDKDNISTTSDSIEITSVDTNLIGEHNKYNVAVAYYICHDLFNISNDHFKKSLNNFKGLPHRLQMVRNVNGVEYYNDSISTASETTIAAIKAIGNVNTLILGGKDRGIDYDELFKFINLTSVENLILLPGTVDRMQELIKKYELNKNVFVVSNMKEAVSKAFEITTKGSVVLSPAAASYGFYKNFEERGEDFINLVNELE